MVESHAVQFGELARAVANRARSLGLATPVFKSPPRIVGVSRTIRRRRDGEFVVAVALRNRPTPAVIADVIDGVVAVNELEGVDAARVRDQLWEPFADSVQLAA